jgi:hypothetical protein
MDPSLPVEDFISKMLELCAELEGTDHAWDDEKLINHASSHLIPSLELLIERKDTKTKLDKCKTFLAWSKVVMPIDLERRRVAAEAAKEIDARIAAMVSSQPAVDRRPLADHNDRTKRTRNDTFVAAMGSASFSSGPPDPAPFSLPARLFSGVGTYVGKTRVAALIDDPPVNERRNIVHLGSCTHCRGVFVFHTTCGVWPNPATYKLIDDAFAAEIEKLLTPVQRRLWQQWSANNAASIAQRSLPPTARKSNANTTGFADLYDDDDFIDDIGSRECRSSSIYLAHSSSRCWR